MFNHVNALEEKLHILEREQKEAKTPGVPSQKEGFSVTEMLLEVGDNNLRFQLLSECLHGNQNVKGRGKNRTTIFCFATDEDLASVALNKKREAVIVWLDRPKLEKAHADLSARCAARKAEVASG